MLRSLKGGGERAVRIQALSVTRSHSAHLDNEGSIDLSFPLFLSSSALQLLASQCSFIFIPLFCKNTRQCKWDSPHVRRECAPSVALFSDWIIRFKLIGIRQPQTVIYCLSWPGNLPCSRVVLRYRATTELTKPAGSPFFFFFFVMLMIRDYMGYDYFNVNETILYIFHPTNSNHPQRAWQGLIAGNP